MYTWKEGVVVELGWEKVGFRVGGESGVSKSPLSLTYYFERERGKFDPVEKMSSIRDQSTRCKSILERVILHKEVDKWCWPSFFIGTEMVGKIWLGFQFVEYLLHCK